MDLLTVDLMKDIIPDSSLKYNVFVVHPSEMPEFEWNDGKNGKWSFYNFFMQKTFIN